MWKGLACVIAIGCGTSSPMGGDDDDAPLECIATSTDDFLAERVESVLEAGRPTITEWSRDGSAYNNYRYTYDASGRMVMQRQDFRPATGPTTGPDGTDDLERAIEHTDTTATITWRSLSGGGSSEVVTYTLDAERVVGIDGADSRYTFTLGGSGELLQEDVAGVDPELGPFTRVTEHTFDAEGRLATRRVTDSRSGAPSTVTYTYEGTPGVLVVHRGPATYTYRYDDRGRVVSAEHGGYIIALAYDDAGAVTTSASRDGAAGRTHTLSAGCRFAPAYPSPPHAWSRPGPEWTFVTPYIPDAYE